MKLYLNCIAPLVYIGWNEKHLVLYTVLPQMRVIHVVEIFNLLAMVYIYGVLLIVPDYY